MTVKEKLIHTAFFGIALILFSASAARTERCASQRLQIEIDELAKHPHGKAAAPNLFHASPA